MKRISFRQIYLSLCTCLFVGNATGQDIAIVGMTKSTGQDKFSFVALEDIPAGQVYYFTDDLYDPATNTFDVSSVETLFEFESPGLVIGDVIVVEDDGTDITVIETCEGTVGCGSTMNLLDPAFSFGSSDELYCFSSSAAQGSSLADIFANMTEIHSSFRGVIPNPPLLPNPANHPDAVNVHMTGADGQFSVALRGNVLTTADLSIASNYVSGDANSTVRFVQLNGATVSGAEIQVLGNDINGASVIPDGSNATSCLLNTRLQTQEANSGPVLYSFTIQNLGTADLNLTGTPIVAISGSAALTIAMQPSSTTIAGGAELDFDIAFNPTSVGTHTATISIANDDTDENPYTFVIGGEAVATVPSPAIAIIGMSSTEHAFSFVALRDIVPGEVFYFTDDTYDEETNSFEHTNGVESLFKYEPAATILTGEVVVVTEDVVDDEIVVTCTDLCADTDVSFVDEPFSFGADDALYCFTSPASNTTAVAILSNVEQIHSSLALAGNTDYRGHDCFHPTALHVQLNSDEGEFNPSHRSGTSTDDTPALEDPANYVSGTVSSTVPFAMTLSCGNIVTESYCYENFDVTSWLYTGSDPAQNLGLEFTAGSIEVFFDKITIYDGADNSAPVLFDGDNGGSLIGLIALSTSSSLYMEVSSDLSVSCTSGSQSTWEWEVQCVDCTQAVATASAVNVPFCTSNSTTYDIEVNVTAIANTSNTYKITNDANLPDIMVNGTGLYTINDVPLGTAINITIEHIANNLCNLVFPEIIQNCLLANDLCTDAVTLNVNAPGACSNNETMGSTIGANIDNLISDCGSLDNQGIWYSFTTDVNQTSVLVDYENLSGQNAYGIYNDCDGTSLLWCNNSSSIVTGLLPSTTYYVLVFHSGSPGDFNICISDPPPPPPNDECANASPIAINPYGTCSSNQITGTTLNSNLDPTIDDCFGFDFPGVWYTFMTSETQTAVNFSFANIGGSNHGYTIYDDCLGTTNLFCGSGNVNDVFVSNLEAETTYYILVYHDGPGEFNICLSDPVFCPDYQDLVGEIAGTGIYSSANDLPASDPNGHIISNQIIRSTADIEYSAGREVVLESGFSTEIGALFHAYIDGCTSIPESLQSDTENDIQTNNSFQDNSALRSKETFIKSSKSKLNKSFKKKNSVENN